MPDDGELEALAAHFVAAPTEIFTTSPLYRQLCPAVAADRHTLQLLTQRRPGQQPSYLLFAAVQYLLLGTAEHELRAYYPALGGEPAASNVGVAQVFLDFVHTYRDELAGLVSSRLVQTNVVRRAVGLRYALSVIGASCTDPVHLVEIGASAGLLLQVDRYRYTFGECSFGPADAPVTLAARWLAATPLPDLDRAPTIVSRIGVDLHPVDAADPDERRWLRALVWPENTADADLLEHALAATAKAPPTIIAGDAIDVCPRLARELPDGAPRVVFHAAVRMHVPAARRADFDAAIDALGADGPLFHVWQEPASAAHCGDAVPARGGLFLHGPDTGGTVALAEIDGHGGWLRAL